MDKETMIQILNQHGIDVLYDVISDSISSREQHAYEVGYGDGLVDGFDAAGYVHYSILDED